MLTSSSKPVQFIGGGPLPEFDFSQEPLPDSIRVLLWMLDGAERRHRLARKWQSHVGHDLHVEVKGSEIIITLPRNELRCDLLYAGELPTASWQTLAGPSRSTVSDLAGGVRRKSLEARQRQGARARMDR